MSKRTPWTPEENRALIALYFVMLDRAISGQTLNKAGAIRTAQGNPKAGDPLGGADHVPGVFCQLADRSRGSIEAKLMNASAAHRDLMPEAETMATHGYKAWGNYQSSLKDAMRDYLASNGDADNVPTDADLDAYQRYEQTGC